MREINVKQAAFVLFMVWVVAFAVGTCRAESWPKAMWNDLKANSSVNLGTNISYGSVHDFVYGDTYTGAKTSLWNWRTIHLEYGFMQRVDGDSPVSHSLGASVYLQPLLNWAFIPEKWIAVKQIYVGPVVLYDKYLWRGGVQLHLQFGFETQEGKIWSK